jgi:hypothetical protein
MASIRLGVTPDELAAGRDDAPLPAIVSLRGTANVNGLREIAVTVAQPHPICSCPRTPAVGWWVLPRSIASGDDTRTCKMLAACGQLLASASTSAITEAVEVRASSSTCAYTAAVTVAELWPRKSATWTSGTPDANRSERRCGEARVESSDRARRTGTPRPRHARRSRARLRPLGPCGTRGPHRVVGPPSARRPAGGRRAVARGEREERRLRPV